MALLWRSRPHCTSVFGSEHIKECLPIKQSTRVGDVYLALGSRSVNRQGFIPDEFSGEKKEMAHPSSDGTPSVLLLFVASPT